VTTVEDPKKPRSLMVLLVMGLVGGIVMVFVIVSLAGDDPDQTRQAASQLGAWSVRLLLLAALIGGWTALRSKKS
jgi:uncharacterized membrane protein YqjE